MVFYFYPPKPKRIWPDALKGMSNDTDWIAELKVNEWRAPALAQDGVVELWNRHGTILKRQDRYVGRLRRRLARVLPSTPTMLDGGLVNYRTTDTKGVYYAFDVVMIEGEWIGDYTYDERRKILRQLFRKECEWLWLPRYVQRRKYTYYKKSIGDGLSEGIVLKHRESGYPLRTDAEHSYALWLKCKKQGAHRSREYYVEQGLPIM